MVPSVIHHYRIVESELPEDPWRVRTAGYHYASERPNGREIIVFHWQPSSASDITTPQVHLEAGAEVGFSALAGVHIPTGRVSPTQFVRFAVEPGVQPLRVDWQSVLTRMPLDLFS